MATVSEQLLQRNDERFRGGLVFKANRWLYHPTLRSRVIKKKKQVATVGVVEAEVFADVLGVLGVRDGEDQAQPHPQLLQVHLIEREYLLTL